MNSNSTLDLSPKGLKRNRKIRMIDLKRLSITINPDELSVLGDTTMMTTMTTMPSESLFIQFQTTYQLHGNTQQVFNAISSFIEQCTSTIETVSSGKGLTDLKGNDISWLVNERNTWRLLYALYKDRATYEEEFDMDDEITWPLSEKEIISNFYKNNSFIREAQLVIDWLERNARDEWELLDRDDIAHYTDRTVAWENTLHQLQTSNIAYKSTREIVTSLDPDAPLRENKPLHDFDMEDEKRLLRQVFFEIRRGQLAEAEKRCIHCGQAWRASTLEGWRLFHDPNYMSKDVIEKLPVEGNPLRDVWKLSAWKMCDDPRVSEDEKAVIGTLCGHLDSVLPQCTNWEDRLWAHTRALVDVQVEREIRDNSIKDYVHLPSDYWNKMKTMEGVLKEIGNTKEGMSPERVIQEMIILGTPSELLVRCAEWVERETQPQFLRFLTHLVLTLRLLGYSSPEHLGDYVIKAYVKALLPERNVDSIAYYCSLLPEEDQIEQYAQFMETVTDLSERQECLSAAEKYEMNISTITGTVVQRIRSHKEELLLDKTLAQEASQEDLRKIEALDWLVFYPHQRAEALWECNALIREFIALKKISTARLAFNKIPPNSPELIMQQYRCEIDDEGRVLRKNLSPKVDSALKEYLCYKAYLDADEGFSHWFEQFHNSKPIPPVKPIRKDFAETVAYDHKLNRYNEDFAVWNERMTHETKIVKAQLHNVLMFPDGGWLIDRLTDEEPRKSHLESLRKLCIPQIFLLLFKILDSMELYDEIMDIANLISDETHRHYEAFPKQHLEDFVQKLTATSITLIQSGRSPFGESPEKEQPVEPLLTRGKRCKDRAAQGNLFLKEYVERVREEDTGTPPLPEEQLDIMKRDGNHQGLPPEMMDQDELPAF